MKTEEIEEINAHISDALEQWHSVMLTADADKWAYHLEYTADDLLGALYIFNHVAQNIGIKNRTLDLSNIGEVGEQLRQLVKMMTGCDPAELLSGNKKAN